MFLKLKWKHRYANYLKSPRKQTVGGPSSGRHSTASPWTLWSFITLNNLKRTPSQKMATQVFSKCVHTMWLLEAQTDMFCILSLGRLWNWLQIKMQQNAVWLHACGSINHGLKHWEKAISSALPAPALPSGFPKQRATTHIALTLLRQQQAAQGSLKQRMCAGILRHSVRSWVPTESASADPDKQWAQRLKDNCMRIFTMPGA